MIHFNINQLEAFIAVARFSSFSKAAGALGISQAAVSTRIANLEIDFGCELFERDRHSTKLSYAGESLLDEAKFIISRCQELQDFAMALSEEQEARVVIGYSPLADLPNSVEVSEQIVEEFPSLEFELFEQSSVATYDDVRDGKMDFGIVSLLKDQLVGLEYLAMGHLEFDYVCHKDFVLAEHERPSKDELSKHRQLQFKASRGEPDVLPRLSPKVTMANTLQGLAEYIDLKMGWCILPKPVYQKRVDAGDWVVLDVPGDKLELRMPVVMIWPKQRALGPVGKRIVDILADNRF
ncbi:LysR family transcriptional regulator [Paraferrimonas sedimenticola]|uniref:LysR family transcriptional regulator n=1 Tax=Paraferrimonas sedimenticola TaxID=375674 RepID=A0AA37W1T9_9GAMM|nr:LysR family transcriptional regulator [Paraferrimonas sedimenticola]GLP96777.1 LysR family transcriptional regulator [Paraferrimonas sedimenticola]